MIPVVISDVLNQQPPNTRRSYTAAWKIWADFATWQKANFSTVLAFIAYLRSKGRTDSTIQVRLFSLRSMYDTLVHAKKVKLNPFRDPRSKQVRFDITPIRRAELLPFNLVRDLLKIPDTRFPDGVRDAAAWAIMFGGGLRRSEVVGLRLDDVRATPKGRVYLRLTRTKSRKEQAQALPKWCLPYLTRLVSQRHHERATGHDWLFVTYWGGRLMTPWDDQALYRRFRSHIEQLELKSVTPHSARATAITKLKEQGFSLDEIQAYARHKTAETTKKYIRTSATIDDSIGGRLEYPGL